MSESYQENQLETWLHYVYCIFCLSGREENIVKLLKNVSINHIQAYSMRWIYKNGKKSLQRRQLLPGYVLFEAGELSGELLLTLQKHVDYLRLLNYTDGSYALCGEDLKFVKWLKNNNGTIGISQVYKEGDRIKVLNGPLKDYEGQIVSVNTKRKCVAISVGEGSVFGKIWCSIDIVEKANA